MAALHQDFKDLLSAFARGNVRYLLIGGYAVSYYSRPRYTKDIDLWIANDLIVSKKAAGRPQDLIGAAELERLK